VIRLFRRHRLRAAAAEASAPVPVSRGLGTSGISWAKLMARVGEALSLACPRRGGDIRLVSNDVWSRHLPVEGAT